MKPLHSLILLASLAFSLCAWPQRAAAEESNECVTPIRVSSGSPNFGFEEKKADISFFRDFGLDKLIPDFIPNTAEAVINFFSSVGTGLGTLVQVAPAAFLNIFTGTAPFRDLPLCNDPNASSPGLSDEITKDKIEVSEKAINKIPGLAKSQKSLTDPEARNPAAPVAVLQVLPVTGKTILGVSPEIPEDTTKSPDENPILRTNSTPETKESLFGVPAAPRSGKNARLVTQTNKLDCAKQTPEDVLRDFKEELPNYSFVYQRLIAAIDKSAFRDALLPLYEKMEQVIHDYGLLSIDAEKSDSAVKEKRRVLELEYVKISSEISAACSAVLSKSGIPNLEKMSCLVDDLPALKRVTPSADTNFPGHFLVSFNTGNTGKANYSFTRQEDPKNPALTRTTFSVTPSLLGQDTRSIQFSGDPASPVIRVQNKKGIFDENFSGFIDGASEIILAEFSRQCLNHLTPEKTPSSPSASSSSESDRIRAPQPQRGPIIFSATSTEIIAKPGTSARSK